MSPNKPRSPRVAAALARIAKYPRPLSPEDAAEVRREMVEFLMGGPVDDLPPAADQPETASALH